MAHDAAEVAPHVYTVAFENERIRLLDVRMKPGDESAVHAHPDYLVYALSDGKVRLTAASGESAEVEVKAGDVMWREPEEHAVDNLGSTDVNALLLELK